MAEKTICDCGRDRCGGLDVVGPNAGRHPVILRTPKGIRFRVEALPLGDGAQPDLRAACVVEMLGEAEVVEVEGHGGAGGASVLRLGS